MAEKETQRNIVLVGFDLEDQEMTTAKKAIESYAKKIENFTKYQELKLEMRTRQKNKGNKKYEIKVSLIFNNNRANAETEELNPFVAIDTALEKVLHEVEHKIKK